MAASLNRPSVIFLTLLLFLLSYGLPFRKILKKKTSYSYGKILRMQSGDPILSEKILNGLSYKFPGQGVDRVKECFSRFLLQQDLDRLLGDKLDDHNRQQANCWIEGIQPMPFHDIHNGKFQWVLDLEKNCPSIQEEFNIYLKNEEKSKRKEEKWLAARNVAGHAYGKEWKTLGLQDRNLWDEENIRLFPETVRLLHDLKVPACEAFFARQGKNSGILPHSDFNNFILTCHLALDVPKSNCWIKVGDKTRSWENGKAMVFDTSIFHSTRNDGDIDRYILLIRFWHPDLSSEEVKALEFIFDYLNAAGMGEAALNIFEAEHLYELTDKKEPNDPIAYTKTSTCDAINGETVLTRQQKREMARVRKKKGDSNRGAKGFHRGK